MSSPAVTKRCGYLEWEDYFMGVALLSAQRSKDPNTQVCLMLQHKTRSNSRDSGGSLYR